MKSGRLTPCLCALALRAASRPPSVAAFPRSPRTGGAPPPPVARLRQGRAAAAVAPGGDDDGAAALAGVPAAPRGDGAAPARLPAPVDDGVAAPLLASAMLADATLGGTTAPGTPAFPPEPGSEEVAQLLGPAASAFPGRPAMSKEEDLELTLQTIMNHIQMDPANGCVTDGDDDDDDDEEDEVRDQMQQQMRQQVAMVASHFDGVAAASPAAAARAADPRGVRDGLVAGGGDSSSSPDVAAPTVGKILRYTLPAIGIWLCSPILSTIDTAAVGLLAGTAQQAALNPAISIVEYGALVAAFLYTATTNLVAAAAHEDAAAPGAADDDRRPRTTATLVTALRLALAVGVAFGTVLHLAAPALLRLLVGNDAVDPAVLSAALRYARVRALGMPAMVGIGTAQSASLGVQDVRSPLYVLAAAAAVNFACDVALVPLDSALFGGAAGAAWATVASQYAALLFFARWMTAPVRTGGGGERRSRAARDGTGGAANVVDVTQGILELTGSAEAGRSRRREFRRRLASSRLADGVRRTTGKFDAFQSQRRPAPAARAAERDPPEMRGFLSGKLTLRSYFSLRDFDRSKASEFLPFVVPVTTTTIGRISGYIAMSHVASSTLGVLEMAAHQIVFSVFSCLTPFADALNQVAQSLVPVVFEARGRGGAGRARALRRTVGNFRRVGAAIGAALVGLTACVPLVSGGLTADAAVRAAVLGALPGVAAFLAVNGLMTAGEGSLLGQRDLGFLRNAYAVFFLAVPACMFRLKRRALAGVQEVGVGTMWATFAVYNVVRAALWHARLAQLQRRTDGDVEEEVTDI